MTATIPNAPQAPAPPAAPSPARPHPNEASIKRAAACRPSAERDAVLANLNANAYARPEDIEADLRDLERRDALSKAHNQ